MSSKGTPLAHIVGGDTQESVGGPLELALFMEVLDTELQYAHHSSSSPSISSSISSLSISSLRSRDPSSSTRGHHSSNSSEDCMHRSSDHHYLHHQSSFTDSRDEAVSRSKGSRDSSEDVVEAEVGRVLRGRQVWQRWLQMRYRLRLSH